MAAAVAGEDNDGVVVVVVAQRIERHRKTTFPAAAPPQVRYLFELGEGPIVEVCEAGEFRSEAGLLEAGDGLAHLADRAAFQAERAGIDDCLVAEIERAQAELLEQRPEWFADTDRGDHEAAGFGEDGELGEQIRDRPGFADGVAGDDEDAAFDPVAEERLPVVAEQVVLVVAQLEVRERVAAVPADEVGGGGTQLGVRQ